MATDEIKEMLIDTWFGRDTTVKDWKRVSKKSYDGQEVRTFLNTKDNNTFWVFGDADDEEYYPAGDYLYCVSEFDGELCAAFNPVSYWNSDHCLYDQHIGNAIATMFPIPDWIELDELCENQFVVTIPGDKTVADVKAAFESAGFLFNQEFNDFMHQFA